MGRVEINDVRTGVTSRGCGAPPLCAGAWLRCSFLTLVLLPCLSTTADADVDFVRDVAPIFEKHCLLCHRSGQAESDLDLSTAAGLVDGRHLVPGDPEGSRLIEVVTASGDARPEMPKTGAVLSERQVEILRQWIADGAQWPADIRLPTLWSLKPLRPASYSSNESIDAFVQARLADRNLKPAPPASRTELIRRLKFDLLGLPPTPEEISKFVNDVRPDAWERLIDRFLQSPHYGERWAQHWLDVVRFSESDGFEDDSPRPHAWPYRDYVIRSINQDKRYDQFVREQIAGDVLTPRTRDGMVATTMLVNGPYDVAAAVSASEVERTRSREVMLEELLTTICQSILGLTVNCARCHDHKFDPVPQVDYYRMKSVFDGVHQNVGQTSEARRILLPEEEVAWNRDEARVKSLQASLVRLREKRENLTDRDNLPPLNRAVAVWQFDASGPAPNTDTDRKGGQSPIESQGTARFGASPAGEIIAANSDGKVLDSGPGSVTENQPEGAGYAIIPNIDGSELVARQGSMSIFARVRYTGRFNGTDDVLRIGDRGKPERDTCGFEVVQTAESHQHARARFVVTGHSQPEEVGVTMPVDLDLDTWYDLVGVFEPIDSARGRITLSVARPGSGEPVAPPVSREVDFVELSSAAGQNLLFFVAPYFANGPQPGAQMDVAAIWHNALTAQESGWLSAKTSDEIPQPSADENVTSQLEGQIAGLEQDISEIQQKLDEAPKALIGYRLQPPPTVVYERGDVRTPGQTVTPAALTCVTTLPADLELPADADEGERRRRFADWVTDPRNPLTARVIVNRVWHHHFGIGIVETPSDFGVNGGRPSHPELLDWLTATFIRDGWSLKALHRRILISETWQQSSRMNPAAAQLDSENRLLWRFTPRRLDAEAVRDSMLFISGELNDDIGGPSFQPFTTTRFNTVFYHLFDKGEPEFNRRTIYRMRVNTGRDPLLDSLDCPAPSVLVPRRRETVTPLQALGLMNDTFVLRQSGRLAEQIASNESAAQRQVVDAWQRALGREPRPEEVDWAVDLLGQSDLTTLCWVLFNSSEFLQIR